MDILYSTFLSVVNMSITASFVILAVMLSRISLKKAPKKFSYMLWSIVGFRLICPFGLPGNISIFNLPLVRMFESDSGSSLSYVPDSVSTLGEATAQNGISSVITALPDALNMPSQSVGDALYMSESLQKDSVFAAVTNITAVLWIIGVALILIYAVISYVRLKKRVFKGIKLFDNIYECDNIPSAFLLGFIKPRIYIPHGLAENEREYIINHEKQHLKRLDYLVKPLAFVLLAVNWFNPLVWISFKLFTRDMEMSCDEKVIGELNADEKKSYSTTLLAFATNRRLPTASPLAFGETGVKSRIKNILKYKKVKLPVIIVSLILIIGIVLSCAFNPLQSRYKKDEAIEEAVSELILSEYSDYINENSPTVCYGEGHKIFDTEKSNGLTIVYGYYSATGFSFINGELVEDSSAGASTPFVAALNKAGDSYSSSMADVSPKYSGTGIYYPFDNLSSGDIKTLFPARCKLMLSNYNAKNELDEQIKVYARKYLEKIGSNAQIKLIGEYEQKNLPQEISECFDNMRPDNFKVNDKFHSFLGTELKLENGKWMVYDKRFDESTNKIYYAKYENGAKTANAAVLQYFPNDDLIGEAGTQKITAKNFFSDGETPKAQKAVLPDLKVSEYINSDDDLKITSMAAMRSYNCCECTVTDKFSTSDGEYTKVAVNIDFKHNGTTGPNPPQIVLSQEKGAELTVGETYLLFFYTYDVFVEDYGTIYRTLGGNSGIVEIDGNKLTSRDPLLGWNREALAGKGYKNFKEWMDWTDEENGVYPDGFNNYPTEAPIVSDVNNQAFIDSAYTGGGN